MLDDTTKVMVFMRVWDRMLDVDAVATSQAPREEVDRAIAATSKITQKLLDELERRLHESCAWELDKDDRAWDGTCGVKWCLTEGGPSVNGMHYCPNCGRFIKEVSSHD